MRSSCKVCKFLKENRFAKAQWRAEVNRGSSLKELIAVLRTLGMKDVSKSTISRHLRECEHFDKYDPRTSQIKKALKNTSRKLSEYFKPEIPKTSKCEHLKTTQFFDIYSEKVCIKCVSCGLILHSYDIEQHEKRMARDPRNLGILESLTRRKRK